MSDEPTAKKPTLQEYVINHTIRGACQCGKCIDAVEHPEKHQPTGHTADLVFFKVAARNDPSAETLKELVKNFKGEWNDCDPYDGKEHSYIELGGWIGDQGLAMQFMGLSVILGLTQLLSPAMLGIPEDLQRQMAGMGMLSIITQKNDPLRPASE